MSSGLPGRVSWMASTTAQHMMVCDLIERNRAATRCTLTERAARCWWRCWLRLGDDEGPLSGRTGKHMLAVRISQFDPNRTCGTLPWGLPPRFAFTTQ
jgi:hypothetical protein